MNPMKRIIAYFRRIEDKLDKIEANTDYIATLLGRHNRARALEISDRHNAAGTRSASQQVDILEGRRD